MASVSGLKVGEASATLRAIGRRQRGGLALYYTMMAVLYLGGGVIGYAVGHFAKLDEILCAAAGAIIGIFAYARLCKRFTIWRFRKKLQDKGTPLYLNLRMELTPDALIYEVQDLYQRAKWPAVSEVFHKKGYWIFLAQASPLFAPERFFANEEEARAFIREALSHMSEAARARSPEALKFLGAEKLSA